VPGYDRCGWYGDLVPLGTPKDFVARLNAAISEVVNVPEMKAALNQQGLEPQTNTPRRSNLRRLFRARSQRMPS
jgi:tripartite-type tricarboxylate transporter receptor subunit TctC